MTIPSLFQLNEVLFDEIKCVEYLRSKDVFYENHQCHICGNHLKYYPNRLRFRCSKKGCNIEVPIRRNTFFDNMRLPINKIMLVGYLWLKKDTHRSICSATGLSKQSITALMGYFRDLVADSLDEELYKIGGPNIIVEIDETKIGKRKYERGHRVDGVWVVGGVERTEERRIFLVKIEKRSKEMLLNVISNHVHPGSIIHTDLWKGYKGLEEINNYTHNTVNHSKEFKNSQTGCHTNTIEGSWYSLKSQLPIRSRNKKQIESFLWEFIWRRANNNNLWNSFINSLKEIHYS